MGRFDDAYIITCANSIPRWRTATAANMVKMAGIPPAVAARWAKVRREMSPAGLKRKLKARVN